MSDASGSLLGRAIGAAMLDVNTYEAVEADRSATGQAAMVVLLVAVSGAIGSWGEGSNGIVAAVVNALVAWVIWAGVTNFVGTRIFGGTADWGELLRTLGFAQAPGLIGFLAILPILGGIVAVLIPVWTLVAGFVAIRQALDISNGKAFVTALVSVVVVVAAWTGVAIVVGVGAGIAALIT